MLIGGVTAVIQLAGQPCLLAVLRAWQCCLSAAADLEESI